MLQPGQTIGILGGGQLARMLAMAAAPYGLHCHIFAPRGDNPAFEVAQAHTEAAYDDFDALARFAAAVDVITYEFENVPAATAAFLQARKPVRPGPKAGCRKKNFCKRPDCRWQALPPLTACLISKRLWPDWACLPC